MPAEDFPEQPNPSNAIEELTDICRTVIVQGLEAINAARQRGRRGKYLVEADVLLSGLLNELDNPESEADITRWRKLSPTLLRVSLDAFIVLDEATTRFYEQSDSDRLAF